MKILISGANGYLGSALKRDLSEEHTVRGTYSRNKRPYLLPMDITDREQVVRTLVQERPDIVVNSVGISGKFKDNKDYATLVNTEGTQNIVFGAQEAGARLIHISSTAVFNGLDGPFKEEDEPLTTDEYGRTKIEGEQMVQASGLSHVILRPSLIVGDAPYGKEDKFPGQVARALDTGVPLDVDNEWRFAPSYTRHVAAVANWWINHPDSTDMLHVVASEATTKLDYARRLAQELGTDDSVFIEKESTGHSGHNILDSGRLVELGAPTITLAEVIAETTAELRTSQTPEGTFRRSKEY